MLIFLISIVTAITISINIYLNNERLRYRKLYLGEWEKSEYWTRFSDSQSERIKKLTVELTDIHISGKWMLKNLHGRTVAYRKIQSTDPKRLHKCSDCKCETTKIVLELDLIFATKDSLQSKIWGWCGNCDIGG